MDSRSSPGPLAHVASGLAAMPGNRARVTKGSSTMANRRVQFKSGDLLDIRHHTSKPGKGLCYPNMLVRVSDEGASGGWDVFDGAEIPSGREVSFYGFSVRRKHRHQAAIIQANGNGQQSVCLCGALRLWQGGRSSGSWQVGA